jgi:ribonuclease HI
MNFGPFFNVSKSKEVVRAGCVLQDPNGNKNMLSYKLEFQCTNNLDEYEALIQGIKKEIDLNVKFIKVYGDSKNIVKQVRNTIHCVSNHLKISNNLF